MKDNFGFFQGKHADRILILGESHHGVSEKDKTKTVVENYLSLFANGGYDAAYAFFDKIVQSFSRDPEKERDAFWNGVYFRNYVCDEGCGIKDNQAKARIRRGRVGYNDVLFQFLNEKGIAAVFVFSRLVYNESLPGFFRKEAEDLGCCDPGTLTVHGRRDYISHCVYRAGVEHPHSGILLDHDAAFFGLRHPSARGGFEPENYQHILGEQLAKFSALR